MEEVATPAADDTTVPAYGWTAVILGVVTVVPFVDFLRGRRKAQLRQQDEEQHESHRPTVLLREA